MFCVNYQGKSSNDQISPLVLSRILLQTSHVRNIHESIVRMLPSKVEGNPFPP